MLTQYWIVNSTGFSTNPVSHPPVPVSDIIIEIQKNGLNADEYSNVAKTYDIQMSHFIMVEGVAYTEDLPLFQESLISYLGENVIFISISSMPLALGKHFAFLSYWFKVSRNLSKTTGSSLLVMKYWQS